MGLFGKKEEKVLSEEEILEAKKREEHKKELWEAEVIHRRVHDILRDKEFGEIYNQHSAVLNRIEMLEESKKQTKLLEQILAELKK